MSDRKDGGPALALVKELRDMLQNKTAQPICCGMGIDDGMSAPMCCGQPDFDWPDDVVELLTKADALLSEREGSQ